MKGRGVGVAVWRVGMAGGCVGSEFEVGWAGVVVFFLDAPGTPRDSVCVWCTGVILMSVIHLSLS